MDLSVFANKLFKCTVVPGTQTKPQIVFGALFECYTSCDFQILQTLNAVECSNCDMWYHFTCSGLTDTELEVTLLLQDLPKQQPGSI